VDCRGHETREKIVQDYKIKPEAHIKLLANQTKYSDAKQTIKDEYYVFSAVRKSDHKKEIIQCGMGAARDLLKLIKNDGLPLFNPLVVDSHNNNVDKQGNTGRINSQNETWDETAKQLYNAIMWLIILWDAKPDTPLFEFRDDVIRYKKVKPFISKIVRVNSTIRNGGKGKTLTDMIDVYRVDNNIRDSICNFDLLQSEIKHMKDKKGNVIKSYF